MDCVKNLTTDLGLAADQISIFKTKYFRGTVIKSRQSIDDTSYRKHKFNHPISLMTEIFSKATDYHQKKINLTLILFP